MKNPLLLIVLLCSCISINSQTKESLFPINPETGEIYYSKVVVEEGKTKDDLYLNANTWFVGAFVSSKNVVQYSDKDEGIIIGKGSFELDKGNVNFTIKLGTKDGKYRYEVYDVLYKSFINDRFYDLREENPKGIMKAMWKKAWVQERNSTQTNIENLISSLVLDMKNNKDTKNDDW